MAWMYMCVMGRWMVCVCVCVYVCVLSCVHLVPLNCLLGCIVLDVHGLTSQITVEPTGPINLCCMLPVLPSYYEGWHTFHWP